MSTASTLLSSIKETILYLLTQGNEAQALQLAHFFLEKNANPDGFEVAAYTYFHSRKNFDKAAFYALEGLKRDPENRATMYNAAKALSMAGRVPEAELLMRKVLTREPDWLDANLELATELSFQGKTQECFELLLGLQKKHPTNRVIMQNLSWHYYAQGDFRKATEYTHEGRKISPWGGYTLRPRMPLWDGSFRGQNILIVMEAGLGDQLLTARFITDLASKGLKVWLYVLDPLKNILARLPGVQGCTDIHHPALECWIPSLEIPYMGGYTEETLPQPPYLRAHPEAVVKWAKLLGPKKNPRVGIRLHGNLDFENEKMRHIDPAAFARILNCPDIEFVSLHEEPKGIANLRDFSAHLKTWDDTAGLMQNLDLTISSCTSTAHLGGALNLATWVIVPIMPYYPWSKPGDHSPWYSKNLKLYRQERFGSWEEPCLEVQKALQSIK